MRLFQLVACPLRAHRLDRSHESLTAFAAAVPVDMPGTQYPKLNLAHQLRQGCRATQPRCEMIGQDLIIWKTSTPVSCGSLMARSVGRQPQSFKKYRNRQLNNKCPDNNFAFRTE